MPETEDQQRARRQARKTLRFALELAQLSNVSRGSAHDLVDAVYDYLLTVIAEEAEERCPECKSINLGCKFEDLKCYDCGHRWTPEEDK